MQDWEELMLNMTSQSEAACQWLVTFLEADQYKYLKPYLLEASCRDIRSQMSSLLEKLFISCYEKVIFGLLLTSWMFIWPVKSWKL